MALEEDFGVHIGTHLESLESLRNGVPEGLSAQCGEVSAILHEYDVAVDRITKDSRLTPLGKAMQLQTARDKAQAAVEKWKTERTTGLDSQMTTQRSALAANTIHCETNRPPGHQYGATARRLRSARGRDSVCGRHRRGAHYH